MLNFISGDKDFLKTHRFADDKVVTTDIEDRAQRFLYETCGLERISGIKISGDCFPCRCRLVLSAHIQISWTCLTLGDVDVDKEVSYLAYVLNYQKNIKVEGRM